MNGIVAFLCGLLFGLGLILSEMVNPLRVQGFLDWFGSWDPTLAFVMGGALTVTLPAFAVLKHRDKPLLAPRFQLPAKQELDSRLIMGSALFGIGWGMAGLCPGPAVTALGSLHIEVFIFVSAMLSGMLIFNVWSHQREN